MTDPLAIEDEEIEPARAHLTEVLNVIRNLDNPVENIEEILATFATGIPEIDNYVRTLATLYATIKSELCGYVTMQ